MARIAGIDIPINKRAIIALTYIYGIGPTLSAKILGQAQVAPEMRVKDLSDDELTRIRSIIEKEYEVEGDLRRMNNMNMKRLMDIGCYRGLRHRRGLPVRVSGRTPTHAPAKARARRLALAVNN